LALPFVFLNGIKTNYKISLRPYLKHIFHLEINSVTGTW
jgi:hypothetical protein